MKGVGFPYDPFFPSDDPNNQIIDDYGVTGAVEGVVIASVVISVIIYFVMFGIGLAYALKTNTLHEQGKITGGENGGCWAGFGIGCLFPLVNIFPPICFGIWQKRSRIVPVGP